MAEKQFKICGNDLRGGMDFRRTAAEKTQRASRHYPNFGGRIGDE